MVIAIWKAGVIVGSGLVGREALIHYSIALPEKQVKAMKADLLLEHLEFHDDNPYAQPLLVNPQSRILRFMLKPGQRIAEHAAPHSPFHVVILQGTGMFSGSDGIEHPFGPDTLLTFDVDETHSVRALDEPLVFLGFLHGVETYRSTSTESGGVLGVGPKLD